MIEKVKISYRDFDYSSFDINNRDVEQENEYKALLSQAYKASPQNATEKEILDDYIRTLKEIIAYYFEINEIRSMIQELQSDAMQEIEDLKNTAAQKAACIYSREQDLSVIRSLGSNALVKMLERSNGSMVQKPEEKATKPQDEKSTNYLLLRTVLMSVSLAIALMMINTPIVLICAITFLVFSPLIFKSPTYAVILYSIYDVARPVLYVLALLVTIGGEQDFFAIAFYILAGLQVISMIKRFVGTVAMIYTIISER